MRSFNLHVAMEFLKSLLVVDNKPVYLFFIPLIAVLLVFEKLFFSLSFWLPLAIAVFASLQYGNHQRQILAEELNRKWKRAVLDASPSTALEHCEWLNKLLKDVWPHYIQSKLSSKLSYTVERRLKYRRPRLVVRSNSVFSFELEDFSLGSSPPSLGLQGMRWSTVGGQKILHTSFDWDTEEMSIMLLAKLSKPLYGTARIVINYLHIKGDLFLMPILDGRAILFSFLTAPEVRLGVALGGGGNQLPGTELPVVSSWLVKLFTDTIVKTMVEPRRRCIPLSAIQLGKIAIGGIIYVTVVSASQISRNVMKGSPSKRQSGNNLNNLAEEHLVRDLNTFVEVELEDLTRRTETRPGTSPRWDSTFNMVLHDNVGLLRFHLYESSPGTVKFDHLSTCEIKIRYSDDDSTIFYAIGPDSGVLVKRAECCGEEVQITVPFETPDSGELTVNLNLKEWQFSDGSHSMGLHLGAQPSFHGMANSRTGRKVYVTVVEGKDIGVKDKTGRHEPYVKLQYGKVVKRTKTVPPSSNPAWNQIFEFDEIAGGEYLKLKCLYEETFADELIGGATINLESLVEGSAREMSVPLEKASSGEIRLQIEVVRESSSGESGNGWIELALIEARDLVGADLRGTSDPYVKVQYGNETRRTKVVYKNLNPKWNQTFEFADDGSPLELQVRDHNAIMSSSSIGNCMVEYQRLPPNESSDKWIPLQGVKKGEIHVQVTRRIPELLRICSVDSDPALNKAHSISDQMKQMLIKVQSMAGAEGLEELSSSLTELQSLEHAQEEYMLQLETERMLLLTKINELGQELLNSSPALSRRTSY